MAISTILTNQGEALLQGAISGGYRIQYTEVTFGDGVPSSGVNKKTLSNIISEKHRNGSVTFGINQSDNVYHVTFNINNKTITQGFNLKEIGIYGRKEGTSNTPVLVFYTEFIDDNIMPIPPFAGGMPMALTYKYSTYISSEAQISPAINFDFGLGAQWGAEHLSKWTGSSNQHPLATATQAGFMSADNFNRTNDDRYVDVKLYTTLHKDNLPPVNTEFRMLKIKTHKSLLCSLVLPSKYTAVKTMMFDFKVISTSSASKSLYVFDTDDTTTVYVDGAKQSTTLNNDNSGEIFIGSPWHSGMTKRIQVVTDNRGGGETHVTFGGLTNCEVV